MDKKKYWIYKTIYYCPVCMSEKVYREREFTEKPEDVFQREETIETYDWCNE
jgi:hypothetical protein